jgi:hypothetical protein
MPGQPQEPMAFIVEVAANAGAAHTGGLQRLEQGSFVLPTADGKRAAVGEHGLLLRPAELAMLLDGVDLSDVRRHKRYQRPAR